MKTLELEIVQGFFFYPHYAFRYIFVKLDFANSVAFFKAFEKAINMYHTSLFFTPEIEIVKQLKNNEV